MKSRFILYLILAAGMVCSCSPDSFEQNDFSNYKVDKVVCEASSNYLIADNVSELDLHVKLYTVTGQYRDKFGKDRNIYEEIPRDRWRNHDIRFFLEDTEITPPYTTSSTTPGTLRFRAEVDDMKSSSSPAMQLALFPKEGSPASVGSEPQVGPEPEKYYFEVTVLPEVTMPARKIPVIFHVLDSRIDADRGQTISDEVLYGIIDQWNDAFSRKSGAPDGVNMNIEFVPALRNASNVKLATPGINRITYSETDFAAYGTDPQGWIWNIYQATDIVYNTKVPLTAANYVNAYKKEDAENNKKYLPHNASPKVYWDTDRYLNVWIHSAPSTNKPAPDSRTEFRWYMPSVFAPGVYDNTKMPVPDDMVPLLRTDWTAAEITRWKRNPFDLDLPPIPTTQSEFNAKRKDLSQVGLTFYKSQLTNYQTDVVFHMGVFLGLVPNAARDDKDTYQAGGSNSTTNAVWFEDFCSDTPVYNMWYNASDRGGMVPAAKGSPYIKYTLTEPYYVYESHNIMDWSSYQTVITPQQAARIDWVLENATGRQMWKNLSGIQE